MRKYIPYIWAPLCLLLSIYSYNSGPEICGGPNCSIVNQMWFMWLVMGLMASDAYVAKCFKCDK